jgi:hypothetical protein
MRMDLLGMMVKNVVYMVSPGGAHLAPDALRTPPAA